MGSSHLLVIFVLLTIFPSNLTQYYGYGYGYDDQGYYYYPQNGYYGYGYNNGWGYNTHNYGYGYSRAYGYNTYQPSYGYSQGYYRYPSHYYNRAVIHSGSGCDSWCRNMIGK